MKVIKRGDEIAVKAKGRIFEGVYKGKHKNCLLAEIKDRKVRIPMSDIENMGPKRNITPKSVSEAISHYRRIVNERLGTDDNYGSNLLPQNNMTISVDLDAYSLYRTLLKMPDPEQYDEPDNTFSYTDSLMTFHNPTEFEKAKQYLQSQGVNFHEIGREDTWTEEDHEPQNVSPYPKNVHDD
jgi:hypothetical protein